MTDLRFTSAETQLIASLLDKNGLSIIWDINAFYINTQDKTYKMECLEEHPEGSEYEFDEIFFCRFEKLAEYIEFDDSQPGYWFKRVATNATIRSIEIIETAHIFPANTLTDTQARGNGITLVSLGALIKTDSGVIPALLLPSNHGFTWLEKQGLYSSVEVEEMLQQNIETYNRTLLQP